jgi:hypothetical protein
VAACNVTPAATHHAPPADRPPPGPDRDRTLAAIATEARSVPADRRHELDRWFTDHRWLAQGPDRIVDLVREQTDRLRPDLAHARETRAAQGTRLALQPALDGTGTGWFTFDADSYARITAALEAAATPPATEEHPIPRMTVGSRRGSDSSPTHSSASPTTT